ncbi:hypothetical protein G6F68_018987 [Rhizopus microsporus]|nr:hypothetical protein G6F68_018987 [Rhizopus microsporus]
MGAANSAGAAAWSPNRGRCRWRTAIPERRGAGALPGQRRSTPRRNLVPGGGNRDGGLQPALAGRATAADREHAGATRGDAEDHPAP